MESAQSDDAEPLIITEQLPVEVHTYDSTVEERLGYEGGRSLLRKFISTGGTLEEMCDLWGDVRYVDVMDWMVEGGSEDARLCWEEYRKALEMRKEWEKERVMGEVRGIALADVRGAFGEYGVKDVREMGAVAKAVSGVTEGKHGRSVKFLDKLKALEMLGKQAGLFVEKSVVVTVDMAEEIRKARERVKRDGRRGEAEA